MLTSVWKFSEISRKFLTFFGTNKSSIWVSCSEILTKAGFFSTWNFFCTCGGYILSDFSVNFPGFSYLNGSVYLGAIGAAAFLWIFLEFYRNWRGSRNCRAILGLCLIFRNEEFYRKSGGDSMKVCFPWEDFCWWNLRSWEVGKPTGILILSRNI